MLLLGRNSSKIKRLGFCLGTSLHPTVERGEESDRVIEETIMDYNQIELTGLLPRTIIIFERLWKMLVELRMEKSIPYNKSSRRESE